MTARRPARSAVASPLIAALALLAPAVARGAVEGRVTTARGVAIEGVRVEVLAAGGSAQAPGMAAEPASEPAFTDPRGRFALPDAEPPLTLRLTHPRFADAVVEVEAAAGEPLEILLEPKQQVFEEIVVTANRGEEAFAPVSVAATAIDPRERLDPPSTLTEAVAEIPGVAESGQGGIFQAYSVRGISKHRVLTLVSGARITTDRRAGVAASFIDPQLLGSAEVLRGPSSTYWGSGALGGVVQLFPRSYDGLAFDAGYESQGDEAWQAVGAKLGGWSVGLAHRKAGDAETPDGARLFSRFEQFSAAVGRRWSAGGLEWELLAVPALARDIGKASADFPERQTLYPKENHLIAKLGVGRPTGWQAELWVHPNDLITENLTPGERLERVDNDSFDLGGSWRRPVPVAGAVEARVGFDYFGRRNVDSRERITLLDPGFPTPVEELRTLDGGEEDEVGAYGALEWRWGAATVVGGGRVTWQRQENAGSPSRDDTALSGFAGLVLPLGGGFELSGNAGSGLRFPTLSERFFTGSTGRGGVIGNPRLDPERSLSADLGLRWFGQRLFVAGYAFRNEIDDYIERIEIGDDLFTFRNLVSGRIQGAELEGSWQATPELSLAFGGHALDGESDSGEPIADVPADRAFAALRWRRGEWGAGLRWERRAEKDDPGSGEKAIPAADLVSASVAVPLRAGLRLTLSASNLLDEEYFNSADEKVPLAPGRSLGVALGFRAR